MDCLQGLRELPNDVVQCVITSPPYWGLRDYGTASWEGGNDLDCNHIEKIQPQNLSKLADKYAPRKNPRNKNRQDNEEINYRQYKQSCGKCGAKRIDQQVGLEETPDEYIQKMVEISHEVKRVLRKDGTLWLNLGDSYSSSPAGNKEPSGFSQTLPSRRKHGVGPETVDIPKKVHGLKPKDLIMMPARVALALQADGWWIRSDIIWHKPNPMPESCTDRPTSTYDHIFLMAKSENYYYDAYAIKEPAGLNTHARGNGINPKARISMPTSAGWDTRKGQSHGTINIDRHENKIKAKRNKQNPSFSRATRMIVEYRNKRNVWTVPVYPYSGAHFATYPPELIIPCILAGTSAKGCCPSCGAPWERVTDYKANYDRREPSHSAKGNPTKVDSTGWKTPTVKQKGWQPTCSCGGDPIPCIVLDPFLGSGTTMGECRKNDRIGIGFELNPDYEIFIIKRSMIEIPRLETYFMDIMEEKV